MAKPLDSYLVVISLNPCANRTGGMNSVIVPETSMEAYRSKIRCQHLIARKLTWVLSRI